MPADYFTFAGVGSVFTFDLDTDLSSTRAAWDLVLLSEIGSGSTFVAFAGVFLAGVYLTGLLLFLTGDWLLILVVL